MNVVIRAVELDDIGETAVEILRARGLADIPPGAVEIVCPPSRGGKAHFFIELVTRSSEIVHRRRNWTRRRALCS